MTRIPSALLASAFICIAGSAYAQRYEDNPNANNNIPASANPVNKEINGSMSLYPSNAEDIHHPDYTAPAHNLDHKHARKHKKHVQNPKTDDTGNENK